MKSKSKVKMNIKRTGLYFFGVMAIACSISACKKDKTEEPTPIPPVEVVSISVQDLKALAKDEAVVVPDGRKISGIVISNLEGKNIASSSLVLQEETGKPGIVINLSSANTFKSGDKLEINISKQKLEKLNGEITLTGIPSANVTQAGTGSITPKDVTVQELTTNAAAWAGTLVKLPAGRFYGGNGKYVAGIEYADASGRVKVGVLDGATFKDQAYIATATQLTGIVRLEGTTARIDIRNTSDVTGGEITRIVVEDFSNITPLVPNSYNPEFLAINGFTTDVDEWTTGELYSLKGNRFDGDFLSASRNYIYMTKIYPINVSGAGIKKGNGINLKGVKTMSITFAGSKMQGTDILNANAEQNPKLSVAPFNSSSDYFQVAFSGQVSSRGSLYLESEKLTKTGEWITVTFTMPTRAELIAMGLFRVTEADIDAYLENPNFQLFNISKRGDTREAPIVIDKIEFGFSN